MSSHNYLHLIAEYDQHGTDIKRLIGSIISSLARIELLHNSDAQQQELNHLSRAYPFVELMYSLDVQGHQLMNTAYSPKVSQRHRRTLGKGSDRSHRPYFAAAQANNESVTVTDPYLSSATQLPAISAVYRFPSEGDQPGGYLVLNVNLQKMIAFLNGDHVRHLFHPLFQTVFSVIGGLLLIVSIILLGAAIQNLVEIFTRQRNVVTESFGIVVLITLGLAIFDLGKTIIEEEVFVHKDIHHHGSTRRTITRFMSAILIAVSIESL
ncbi:MAG: hypothetical protein WED11_00245, partial [Natronospirillum sp.]